MSFLEGLPVRRAAFGPPAQQVRSGARIGSGVQKVGNAALGEWKKAAPGARRRQNSSSKASATRITGPVASFLSASRFSFSLSKEIGRVRIARRAFTPLALTNPRRQVRSFTGDSSRRRVPLRRTAPVSQSSKAP